MNKIAPSMCQYCGGNDFGLIALTIRGLKFIIECRKCSTQGPHGHSEKRAIELWNEMMKEEGEFTQ